MKIASIVGARPNFIKLAPVSREIRKVMDEVIIHTGQHYDYEMDRIFFDELGIPPPHHHLGVGSGSHGQQTGLMLAGIEQTLQKEKPDISLVFGDTNTTLAGALAAAKLNIPVAHVEAGLRSFDRRMPEEVNRVLTDHLSDLLFCPTKTAILNLKKEGISRGVYRTGDVMVDIMDECIAIAERHSSILTALSLQANDYILTTVHRAENTDDPIRLASLVHAFREIATAHQIIFPCHPRTQAALKRHGLWNLLSSTVTILPPIGYLDMLVLEKNASRILTDSGGVQKEAYLLGVPCITLRTTTEWVETVEDGWNILAGTDSAQIIRLIKNFTPPVHLNAHKVFKPGASGEITRILSSPPIR